MMDLRLLVVTLLCLWGSNALTVDKAPRQEPDQPSNAPPRFSPPGAPEDPGQAIECEYNMPGWTYTNRKGNRGAWLKQNNGSGIFDIYTDNDDTWPEGIKRTYYLEVKDQKVNLDGVDNPGAKVVNGTYPGPWIQACWGDEVEITVKNKLKHNGTAIHMHGMRMLDDVLMDGVPGVTQCPIAPGESYTYRFRATQYGTTWYHSHYSLQYPDGVLGPLTIHGPSSADYDDPIDPILMTDHIHESAFALYYRELYGPPPQMQSILLNGQGNYQGRFRDRRYKKSVKAGKKYLMRLINTSVDTTFIFSIDDHEFTVVQSDLVTIEPYKTNNLAIGIGQRYHVVLETLPDSVRDTDRFWIRTTIADGCGFFETEPDDKQGILYYGEVDDEDPTTVRGSFDLACRDEPFDLLKPTVEWNIPRIPPGKEEQFLANRTQLANLGKWTLPGRGPGDPVNYWAWGRNPMWVNFSSPTVKSLDQDNWDANWVVHHTEAFENHNWVYLLISGLTPPPNGDDGFLSLAHPIHIHGHDFVLLAYSEDGKPLPPLNYRNPPRRDVVLLPAGGNIVLAFREDNPGSWLLHCHIAWHASAGLGLQMLESQEELRKRLESPDKKHDIEQMDRTCHSWEKWYSNKQNWWDPEDFFQEDSGI